MRNYAARKCIDCDDIRDLEINHKICSLGNGMGRFQMFGYRVHELNFSEGQIEQNLFKAAILDPHKCQ